MVFIRDEGVFDAPIDKVWKFLGDMSGTHRHEMIQSMTPIDTKGNVTTFNVKTKRPDGKSYTEVWRMTNFPPEGFMVETLEGPAKGSTNTHTYIPQGNQTKVIVSGEFVLEGQDEATTRKMTLEYLNNVFNEDSTHLKTYK